MSAVREIITQQELDKRKEAIELCGKNRGPHQYIPISWSNDGKLERVEMLMCKVCFSRVAMKTLYEHYGETRV
jgi:hypothetical protein